MRRGIRRVVRHSHIEQEALAARKRHRIGRMIEIVVEGFVVVGRGRGLHGVRTQGVRLGGNQPGRIDRRFYMHRRLVGSQQAVVGDQLPAAAVARRLRAAAVVIGDSRRLHTCVFRKDNGACGRFIVVQRHRHRAGREALDGIGRRRRLAGE